MNFQRRGNNLFRKGQEIGSQMFQKGRGGLSTISQGSRGVATVLDRGANVGQKAVDTSGIFIDSDLVRQSLTPRMVEDLGRARNFAQQGVNVARGGSQLASNVSELTDERNYPRGSNIPRNILERAKRVKESGSEVGQIFI